MPAGIQRASEIGRRPVLGLLGVALAIAFEASALVLTPFVFAWVTGSWSNVWLLALPIVAIIVPIVVIVVINQTIWPKGGADFPRELMPKIRGIPFPLYFDHPAMIEARYADMDFEYIDEDAEPEPQAPVET